MGKRSAAVKERRAAEASAPRRGEPPAPSAAGVAVWQLLLVALLAVAPFLQTLGYEFVYDDDFQVLRNPVVRDVRNLGAIFGTGVWGFMNVSQSSNYYRPVHMMLHMLGYHLSGLDPIAYHAINILLHALCTTLVVLLAARLTRDRWLSLAAGAIYALHPIHAESVTWVAAVTDPSCTAFYLGALYFHLRDAERPARVAGPLVVASAFFLALLSKEMAFTFPVVALLADWLLARRLRWSRYALLAGVFGVYALLRVRALGQFMIRQTLFELDPAAHVLSTVAALTQYLAKLVVPYDISAFHVFYPTRSLLEPSGLLALVVLALLGAAAWTFRADRTVLFLLGFSFVTLAPVLNLQGVGENVFADRYLYLPTAASSILLPLAARALWRAHPIRGWNGGRAAAVALGLLLVAYGALLWTTVPMWRDNPTLYTETLRRSPDAMLISNNLGQYYLSQASYDKAREAFQNSVTIWPGLFLRIGSRLASAYAGLGGVSLKQMKLGEARDYFLKAYEISGPEAVVFDNLGSVYLGLGDTRKARDYYQKAVAINPRLERIHSNLAALALAEGDLDGALASARRAIAITPRIGEPYIIMGRAYVRKGQAAEARESYRKALEVDPSKAPIVEGDLKKFELALR